MIYNLSSDYHLFTKRAAHTTPDSAQKLQKQLYAKALEATAGSNNLCLGDLFDKSTNPEAALVQGYEVAKRCQMVMSGNHDLTNREGVITTLDALHGVMDDRIVIAPNLSEPYFEVMDSTFWIVPHHASQTLFEKALFDAKNHADAQEGGHRYLLLHCNYDIPFDSEDSTLNLSPELAEGLLQVFSRIFIGHEHNSKTHFDDRVVLVGNTHPTSFSDISDKFCWELNTCTDELIPWRIWTQDDCYREVKFGDAIPNLAGVQFVDVIGTEPVEDATEVAQFVRQVWNAGKDLLAVRNNVEIIDHLSGTDVDTSRPALVDLQKRIHDDLEGSDLQPVYSRLVAQAKEA